MKNKKRNIIDALHGSFMFIDNLPSLLNKETIYNQDGIVDGELLTAVLEWMSHVSKVTNEVSRSLSNLIGIDESPVNSGKNKPDNGKTWNVEDILKHCTLEDNVLKLPAVQFNKKSYAEAKKWIEEAGGNWQGGKVQGFTFPFNADRVFSILKEGKKCNLHLEYQFFETPNEIADWLVMLAGGIHDNDTVLEPSAGRGSIIKAIHRSCPSVVVECYELMPENREFLNSLENVILLGEDFTKNAVGCYSKIIANPPFSNNQDIDHVRLMYEHLTPGGTLAAITSPHWRFASEKKCVNFRDWLDKVNGKIFDIAPGEFKENGTTINTIAIVITKHDETPV